MTWLYRHVKLLLAAYSVCLALALFWPSSDRQSAAVVWLADALTWLGLPATLVTFGRLEVVLNAAIVVPVTLLASAVRPDLSWRDWTALAFCVAVGVEVVQGLLLPGRQASFSDVVANTLGALAGAVLVAAVRPMLRTRLTTKTST
jgi:glycopeptide antibiotics resistance protein